MIKNKKKAFTLVELIVVIIILAILGTIAFISLQGYSRDARDSVRISDISKIKTSLELFQLDAGKYPLPDSGVEYSFSGELLWTQGTIGDNVIKNLSRNIQEKPLDPSMDTEYIYSVTNSKTQYEILVNYESDSISKIDLQNGVYAANFTPKITGIYNGIYIKSLNYIIPSPSILNALNQTTDFNTDNLAIKSQVISGGENNIKNGKILLSTGGLADFSLFYTGTINSVSTDADKISVIDTLQNAYSGTIFASNSEILYVLSKTTDETKKLLADQIILNTGVVSTTSQDQDLPQEPETPINYCTTINPSLVSYWKFDQEYNDNFSGTSINDSLWTSYNNTAGATTLTQNEKIIIQQTSYSGVRLSPSIQSNYYLSGDFDTQIDYKINSIGTSTDSGIRFQVFSQDKKNIFMVYRQFPIARYQVSQMIDYVRGSITQTNTTDTTGKFRITRVGNVLTGYYWNSSTSAWVSIGTYTDNSSQGYLTGDIGIKFTFVGYQSNGANIEFDNFRINKGKIITDSKLTNTGTLDGSTWTTGKVGKALSFDGNDYVTVLDNSSLDITDKISLSAWVKASTVPPSENKYIAGKNRYSDNSRSYLLYLSTSGVIGFSLNPDGTVTSNKALGSASTLTSGIWNHIVGTYDGTKMKLYINGQYSSEKDYTGSIYSSSAPFRIAGSGESTPTNLFNGLVDEVAVFNKGLSQEEVTKIYNDGIAGNNICGN